MIPAGFISNLLDRADIVDVVQRYVPLQKKGRNWMACCPFHKEKTPSFAVNPQKQFYKCYGCGKAGDAIRFIMEMEHLEFPEAVEKLAGIYGMDVPRDRSPRAAAERERAKSLADFMKDAADFYTAELRQSQKGIEYLKARGISGETAARFALGVSPEGWHGLKAVFGDKYESGELLTAGLVNEKNGRRYDAFRDRLMFPIRNVKGLVIGFGARTFKGDEQPKYLNSPETPTYHKGSELYGLFEARDDIRERGRAVVCEGYMDVIQLSQAGFRESVAALGTSITPEHVRRLFKTADTVYFSFDGDAAGRKAARRALEAALPVITDLQSANFILLPPEHDPDSLIKAEGPEAFEREIKRALPLTQFLLSLVTEGKDLAYAEDRSKVVAEAKPLVLSMQAAPVLRLSVIRELANVSRLPAEDISRTYGLAVGASSAPPHAAPPDPADFGGSFGSGFGRPGGFTSNRGQRPGGWRDRREQYRSGWGRPRPVAEARIPVKDVRERMLQCFLAHPRLLTRFSRDIEEVFVSSQHPAAVRIVDVWRAAAEAEEETGRVRPATLLANLEENPSVGHFRDLLSQELVIDTPEEGAALEVRRAFLELELERTRARLMEEGRRPGCDIATLRKLEQRRVELERGIADAKKNEADYRQREEFAARTRAAAEAKARVKGAAGAKPDMVFSENPKVRALQEMLFGRALKDDADGADETGGDAPQGATPAQPARAAQSAAGQSDAAIDAQAAALREAIALAAEAVKTQAKNASKNAGDGALFGDGGEGGDAFAPAAAEDFGAALPDGSADDLPAPPAWDDAPVADDDPYVYEEQEASEDDAGWH